MKISTKYYCIYSFPKRGRIFSTQTITPPERKLITTCRESNAPYNKQAGALSAHSKEGNKRRKFVDGDPKNIQPLQNPSQIKTTTGGWVGRLEGLDGGRARNTLSRHKQADPPKKPEPLFVCKDQAQRKPSPLPTQKTRTKKHFTQQILM